MFLCEHSCYPKPVVHLWGRTHAFLKSKFQSWLLGSLLHRHIPVFYYCTTDWHKLPNPHLQCLSCLESLLFTFLWRPANFALSSGLESRRDLWSHWVGPSMLVFRRQLAGRTLVVTSVSVISADAACWTGPDFLKCSSLWIVGFSNTYIKVCVNKPQSHPINSIFYCKWRQNWSLMPTWS